MLACSLLLSAFCGCGGNNTQYSFPFPENTSPPISEKSESTHVSTTAPTITNPPTECKIIKATDFSDGLAWIQIQSADVTLSEKIACINQKGEIQFFLNTDDCETAEQIGLWNSVFESKWHNGTSVLSTTGKYSNGIDRIYDSKGNIIFETDETYTAVKCYAEGYYAVSKQIKSIDKNEHYISFFNIDGSWQKNEWNLNTTQDSGKLKYLGEGMFYYADGEVGQKFYDINTNTSFNAEGIFEEPIGQYSNGIMVLTSTKIFDNKGNTSKDKLDKTYSAYSSGFSGRYAAIFSNEYQSSHFLCYDSQTKELKNIVSYTNGISFLNKDYSFDGDKIVVLLRGADNKYYFTTFTADGKQLYEPINCKESKVLASEDRIIVEKDNSYSIYDYNGTQIFEYQKSTGNKMENAFSDNTVRVQSGQILSYLNNTGNTLFDKLTYQNQDYSIVND